MGYNEKHEVQYEHVSQRNLQQACIQNIRDIYVGKNDMKATCWCKSLCLYVVGFFEVVSF